MTGRIRTVKPEWLDDERLAAEEDHVRVLSVGLLLLADDYGRGRAHPLFLASHVWPYTEAHEALRRAEGGLAQLQGWFIDLYEVAGQRYFAVRNWSRHQKVQHPSAPRVPLPKEGRRVRVSGEPPDTSHEVLTPDLRSPITDQDLDQDPDHRSPTGEIARERARGPSPSGTSSETGINEGIVVEVFSRLRQGAGGAAYRLSGSDRARVKSVVAWAVEQAALERCPPTEIVGRSITHYLTQADDGAREKGWPFAFWAQDPGAWLRTGANGAAGDHGTNGAAQGDDEVEAEYQRLHERLQDATDPDERTALNSRLDELGALARRRKKRAAGGQA